VGTLSRQQWRAINRSRTQQGQQAANQYINEGLVWSGLEWTAWTMQHGANIAASYVSGGASTAARGLIYVALYGGSTALAGGASARQATTAAYFSTVFYYYHPVTGELIGIAMEQIPQP
jgi:hypothetical protein